MCVVLTEAVHQRRRSESTTNTNRSAEDRVDDSQRMSTVAFVHSSGREFFVKSRGKKSHTQLFTNDLHKALRIIQEK